MECSVDHLLKIQDLLQNFGLRVLGISPGVSTCRIDAPSMPLNFGTDEWDWLEPLLQELLTLRDKVSKL